MIETLTPLLARDFNIKSFSKNRYQLLRLCEMIVELIKNRRITTVVLIDSYSTLAFWYTIAVVLLCKRYKIPYIPILHGGDFPKRLTRSPLLTGFVFRDAVAIISPSGYLKEAFERHQYTVRCIPNSINIDEFPFLLRNQIKVNILWVRSFHEIYNPMMAISVLALLKEKYPFARLCMVGAQRDETYKMVTEEIRRKHLEDSVVLTGAIPRSEWVKLSINYDVFINTSKVDNTPVSVLEAMSLGLPIVSTNVGGVPYLISDKVNGLLVSSNKPVEMAQRIIWLVENRQYVQQLSVSARRYVENFDWSVVRNDWVSLLSKFEQPLS